MRRGLVVLGLAPIVFLQSCTQPQQTDATSTASAANTGAGGRSASPFATPRQTASGKYFVVLTPRPDPIPLNVLFGMDVAVYTDASLTVPAAATSVRVDAGMPAHRHGMNLSPRTTRTGEGRFRVEGMLMHMPGAWEVYADVTTDGGAPDRASFEVEVR